MQTSSVFRLKPATYNRFLKLVAGLGGLLYGIDVGIIAGALPYLEATSGLNAGQISFVVAAVLLGTVISTLFAGLLADGMGRKRLMIVSGALFAISIPIIALSHSFEALILGRLCQGISAGLIGVVVPLYLAECLAPEDRGQGTAMFQWLLTLGIVAAAGVGMYFSLRVEEVAKLGNAQLLFAYKDRAWRSIFWVSLPPGLLFVLGGFFVAESPRWLFRRGRKQHALDALLRSRSPEKARLELEEMENNRAAEKLKAAGRRVAESLLQRKYVIPFILACVILACNQATGINSIIGYNTAVLIQSGLSDVAAHWGYILFTVVQALATIVGMVLVDRKGRRFLLSVGTAGIVVSLLATAFLFHRSERYRVDVGQVVQTMVDGKSSLKVHYTPAQQQQWLTEAGDTSLAGKPTTLTIIYSYGDFSAVTPAMVSNQPLATPVQLDRSSCVPGNKVVAFFSDPFGNLEQAQTAPLRIQHALITPLPSKGNGWLVALSLYIFVIFYAMGPGICVWLALSELMPTRIRSNGMSIALVLNEAVATFLAAIFLPTVGRYGYTTMFMIFAGCTVIYFLTVFLFLPETKGKTLEEIEAHFSSAGVKA
ncbi:MAG: sugar porter family MFS transporter, partial [Acidobacteria bacterium]|nr:sugar porter family MFS transporter [Acidobacteriota bacterium]